MKDFISRGACCPQTAKDPRAIRLSLLISPGTLMKLVRIKSTSLFNGNTGIRVLEFVVVLFCFVFCNLESQIV